MSDAKGGRRKVFWGSELRDTTDETPVMGAEEQS